ncbi:GNAT family N-acetyltransferase [Paenibacillus sp. GCM10028914]|uniref:GNAT family N-acetyltransferase n=1 Tax=Paenibacillus sp. GCM10028914 TaxID=3273416 RepID=UPI003608E66A
MLKKVTNTLTPEIYIELRRKVGFKQYSFEDVAMALEKTLFSVVIYDADKPVGIGRVLGDDRVVFFIKDVVVDPDYQNRSIGHDIMLSLMEYIEGKACKNAYVGLMSTPNKEGFYKKFGFIQRPNEEFGHGMVKFVNNENV